MNKVTLGPVVNFVMNRTIRGVTILDEEEALNLFGYKCRVPALVLDDESMIVLMQDAEGNGPGAALWVGSHGREGVIG